ncbi:putative bifunctional diguanylate cyclase/phosphodiesterase [Vibrio orientalis]|uniref:EAL domain protein n=2 Tax=Vibrio orientalis CIP 102891 = ATCC 33934 TaxID=675816 RepID=A0ABM9YYG8_VIBOR|nr:GGDEF domain-containing phosphodiesterase [Vibrio orientalis]EEX92460.1 EAL domain protein [Vibrio orientalis CIP 102891 = ATCC 33934]
MQKRKESVLQVGNSQTMLYALTGVYLASVYLISYTLITEHHIVSWFYLLFPIAMLVAYFVQHFRIKLAASIISLVVLFGGGIIEPLELDAIEEAFIVLPLCYIILFPGSLWPIAVGAALILSYLINLPAEEFDEFIEDAIEVAFITVFATIMTYFQQKSEKQSNLYKEASLTDYLTKLPNRKAFFNAVHELKACDTVDYAALQIGLDNLKKVNDDLGYGYGDALLLGFSRQMKRLLGESNQLYRLGGDDLIALIKCTDGNQNELNELIEGLRVNYDSVCQIHNTSHRLRYYAGIAMLSDAQNNIKVWGKNVDVALAKSKRKGDGVIQWYDDELMNETIREHQIEIELKGAIDNEQMFLVYQPKVDVKSQEIIGAEALLRWEHPDLGFVPPCDFIGVAEKTAQIIPIGRWVIEQAIKQSSEWRKQGYEICISVNVSSVQFAHDDIYPYISEMLKRHQLPSKLLQIEITETAMMDKYSHVADTCQLLQDAGVSIAIDDFGVEYSSLNYLKQLPIDTVKIDKSFIDDCVEDITGHMIVRTIIQMAHNLGKTVIAEGVEHTDQLELLNRENCHQFQGYLFSKPILPSEFMQLLKQ